MNLLALLAENDADGNGGTAALIVVIALTVLFAVIQARRTTLRRGRARDEQRRGDS